MLAYILAIIVGIGSLAIYLAAFFFPEIHRRQDFIWSGVGLFYALTLWACAGRITGAVVLGQTASVALLCWFGWQTLNLRRQTTPLAERTPIPTAEQMAEATSPQNLKKTFDVKGLLTKMKPQPPKVNTPAPTSEAKGVNAEADAFKGSDPEEIWQDAPSVDSVSLTTPFISQLSISSEIKLEEAKEASETEAKIETSEDVWDNTESGEIKLPEKPFQPEESVADTVTPETVEKKVEKALVAEPKTAKVNLLTKLKNKVKGLLNKKPEKKPSEYMADAAESMQLAATGLVADAIDKAENVAETLTDKMEDVVEVVSDKMEDVVAVVTDKVEDVVAVVTDKVEDVVDAIADVVVKPSAKEDQMETMAKSTSDSIESTQAAIADMAEVISLEVDVAKTIVEDEIAAPSAHIELETPEKVTEVSEENVAVVAETESEEQPKLIRPNPPDPKLVKAAKEAEAKKITKDKSVDDDPEDLDV
jgi:hypothetical protein